MLKSSPTSGCGNGAVSEEGAEETEGSLSSVLSPREEQAGKKQVSISVAAARASGIFILFFVTAFLRIRLK